MESDIRTSEYGREALRKRNKRENELILQDDDLQVKTAATFTGMYRIVKRKNIH